MSIIASRSRSAAVWRPNALQVQRGPDFSANHARHDQAEGQGQVLEKLGWAPGKIDVIQPPRRQHRKIKVFLAHFFDRPGRRPLLRSEPRVEVKSVFFLDVKTDESRIGNDNALIFDIGQLAFWSTAVALPVFLKGKTCEFQQQHGLGHKGASIG